MALVALGSPGVCGPNTEAAYEQLPGWTLLERGDVVVYWVRPGPSNDRARLWIRQEYPRGQGGYRSNLSLLEVDCSAPRYRVAQFTDYDGPQTSGRAYPTPRQSQIWQYAPPGSIAERLVQYTCRPARAPRPAPHRRRRRH